MTGLLTKDFRLLTQRKSTAVMFAGIALMLTFTMNASFVISYFSLVGCLMAMSTLSLDQFDNGMAFMFTLPVTKKLYTIEKYIFSFLWLLGFWFTACVLQFGVMIVQKTEFNFFSVALDDVMTLFFLSFVIFIMIPINLKFGADKGRIVMLIIFAIAIIFVFLGEKILTFATGAFGIDGMKFIVDTGNFIASQPAYILALGTSGIFIAFALISLAISIHVMEKKEY